MQSLDWVVDDLLESVVIRSYSSPGLTKEEQNDLFVFLESLANSTYINFQDIKPSPVVEVWYHHKIPSVSR